jgi:nuclear-control-of-ATPase protein 2
MSLALAQDKLSYSAEQLANLSAQIREGDLTPVLRIYEDDIRSPVRSVIGGTLLRSVFIQVQKAKVDIDQALAGIDKLLKSQELTFAFVGVAPAFAIVWALTGAAKRLWVGGSRKGRYGGQTARARTLASMRQIERLLVSSSAIGGNTSNQSDLSPLTTGLLVISLTHVRRYAERNLPASSRLREGMLEDIGDLEDPALGRMDKIKVVERMWRCWGGPLGWGSVSDDML